MERRKALALAASITGVLGSVTVAVAALGGVSLLGFDARDARQLRASVSVQPLSGEQSRVVTRRKDVYDTVVVDSTRSSVDRSAAPASVSAPASPNVDVPAPTSRVHPVADKNSKHHRSHSSSSPAPRQSLPPPRSTTSVPEALNGPVESPESPSSTTIPPTTTTTWPRGVPHDWPPNKPIPPMPPNCREPQLEDNGVWNCQDD